jgi:hypothetical protein
LHAGSIDFQVEEFSNGDIFIIIEKTQLFRVRKTSYTVADVSRSLFDDQPELANGVARIEFLYSDEGEGFKLTTNDGKNYAYYPLTHELQTRAAGAGGIHHSAANSDYPDVPAQLIAYFCPQ